MPVEKSVVVPRLGADDTFALLTEPRTVATVAGRDGLVSDLRAGGEYRWTIIPGHTAAGRVVAVEPGRRLVLTGGWEGADDPPPGTSTVTITLEPTEGGTIVRLVHEGLSDDQAAGHSEGWEHYLERLSIAAREGDAGADEWALAPSSLDSLTAAEAALAACQIVLRGLDDADLARPTPCRTFTVAELVDHLVGSVCSIGSMAGASVSLIDGTPEARVASAAQRSLEEWRRRGTDGVVTTSSGALPARLAANILSIEFLVHGWDVRDPRRRKPWR